ncbi:Hypothetical protein MCYN_0024 [Mycoplasmopsis cynos C142]|uniref:Uncharacterized protein n=1 Tax=Mycoplasmopsis cynos (strain C142) TaxID=1246955 RepID=L0RVW3_MYCC1|nr:Hypothetical protein MCYN_0024 [Mycoplasmopsis cynos C142]
MIGFEISPMTVLILFLNWSIIFFISFFISSYFIFVISVVLIVFKYSWYLEWLSIFFNSCKRSFFRSLIEVSFSLQDSAINGRGNKVFKLNVKNIYFFIFLFFDITRKLYLNEYVNISRPTLIRLVKVTNYINLFY